MSTYIVEVDSGYRDLNAYPNQCDFAVSFNQNLTTAPQVLGQPYSFSGTANNFFTKCSIDPDYQNSNLRVIGGNIQRMERLDTSFFISGVMYDPDSVNRDPGFWIYDGETLLFSISFYAKSTPYLCRLDKQVDGSYTLEWIVYAEGFSYEESSDMSILWNNPATRYSSVYKSFKKGLFWIFDFNFARMSVKRNDSSYNEQELYLITPNKDNNEQWCNMVFAFDTTGNPYFVNNRPWGYHLLKSSFKLQPVNFDGTLSIEVDAADNAYILTNMDPTDVDYVPVLDVPDVVIDGKDLKTAICVYRTSTGPTLDTEYMISDGYAPITQSCQIQVVRSLNPDSLENPTFTARLPLNELNLYGFILSRQSYICEIGDYIYYITTGLDEYNVTPGLYPLWIYRINPIAGTMSLFATTPSRFYSCKILLGCNNGVDKIYIAGRTNNAVVYMYSINVISAAVTELTSLSLPTTVTEFTVIGCAWIDSDNILVVSPDRDDIMLTGNYYTRSKTLWIMKYTISTNSLMIIDSSIQIYSNINTMHFDNWNPGFITFNLNYRYPSEVDFITVDKSTLGVSLRHTFPINSQYSVPFVFDTTDINGNTKKLFMIKAVTNQMNVYDITTFPPLLLSTDIYSLKSYGLSPKLQESSQYSVTSFVTPYGYMYSSSYYGLLFKFRFATYPNPKLTSEHFYSNPSSTITVLETLDIIESFAYAGRQFLYISGQNSIQLYEVINNTNLLFVSQYIFDIPFSERLYQMQIQLNYNEGSIIYIGLSSSTQTYIFYTDYLLSNCIQIGSYTPEVDIFAGLSMIYTIQSTNPFHYLLLTEQGGRIRKFELSGASINLITSGTFPATYPVNPSYINGYHSTRIYYYPNYQIYVLVANGNYYNGNDIYGELFQFDITNYVDLTPTNATQPIYPYFAAYKTQILDTKSTTFGETSIVPVSIGYAGSAKIYAGGSTVIMKPYYPDLDTGISIYNFSNYDAMNFRGYNLTQPVSQITTMSGAFTFQSAKWTNSITNRQYVALNVNGNMSESDSISIMDVTNPNVMTQVGSTSIIVDGIVRWMTSYTIGTRNVLAMIVQPLSTGANRIWLYDVSNIDSAVNGQSGVFLSKTYTDIGAIFGAGIIHKIDSSGNPDWLCYAGGNLMPGCSECRFQQMSLNPNGNLYVGGGWTNHVQFFSILNVSSGASTALNTQPLNDLILLNGQKQGFVAEIDTFNGNWRWVVPIAGIEGDLYIKDIMFCDSRMDLACVSYFSSTNAYIYEPQISSYTGTTSTLGRPQRFFFNSSSTNSILFVLSTSGVFQWRAVLFGEDTNSYINLTNIWVDETNSKTPSVIVAGSSNSVELRGEDGKSTSIQTLYAQINSLKQSTSVVYTFSLDDGRYQSSVYQALPIDTTNVNNLIRSYSDLNITIVANSVYSYQADPSPLLCYNRDSSFGGSQSLQFNVTNCVVSSYDTNSMYLDYNGKYYSTVCVYDFSGPISTLNTPNAFANSYIFVQGDPLDILINKNFIIRSNTYNSGTNALILVLNQQISVDHLIRRFSTINNIQDSNQYYSSNLSASPLYDVGYYTTGGVNILGNSITFTNLFNNPPGTFDMTKDYYFMIPTLLASSFSTLALGDVLVNLVPITSIVYDSTTKQYTMTVSDINDLRVPSPSGPFYGPYINIGQKNYSAFYSLQWYPGARLYSQSYLVGLYDLIIPNRPVRNAQFPGIRYITDYPYIYLVIYNANEVDAFDSTVVNSVYDNNVNVPRFALFQLPTTSFTSFGADSNFISATSSTTPRIKFVPGYYKLHIKITDDLGNVLYFDNAPSKDSDSIFADGVVPEKLLKVTARLAFKRG